MAFAYCPDCGGRLYLGRTPWLGQPVSCESCEAELEVTRLQPPELSWSEDLIDSDWNTESEMADAIPA